MSTHVRTSPRRSGRRRFARLVARVAVPVALLSGASTVPFEPAGAAVAPRRINAGAGAVTDSAGQYWSGDRYYAGGGGIHHTAVDIARTTDDAIFQTNRWGMTGYDIPVSRNSTYRVRLLFAETVFTTPGTRVFDVSAEGRLVIDDLDVLARAGHAAAYSHTFLVPVRDKSLTLRFGRVADDPMVSGIEVVEDRSGSTTTTTAPTNTTTTTAPASPTTTAPVNTTTTTVAPTTTTTAPPAPTTTTTVAPAPTTTTTAPPATTTTTTAPPAPTTGGACPAYPAFPDGNCTGWRHTGVTLSAYSGPTYITTSGTVIDGKLINGDLTIRASNVTIRRSQVNGTINLGYSEASNVLIEDVEVNAGNTTYAAIGSSNFTCRRCNIYGGGQGINGYNFTVEDSWIHDLYGTGTVHSEAILGYGGNMVVRHNRLSGNYNSASGGFAATDGGMSSSVSFYTHGDWGPINNVVFEKNRLNVGSGDRDYAGFCLYGGGSLTSNSTFRDNVFARHPLNSSRCGYHGTVTDIPSGAGSSWTNNRYEDGTPV